MKLAREVEGMGVPAVNGRYMIGYAAALADVARWVRFRADESAKAEDEGVQIEERNDRIRKAGL